MFVSGADWITTNFLTNNYQLLVGLDAWSFPRSWMSLVTVPNTSLCYSLIIPLSPWEHLRNENAAAFMHLPRRAFKSASVKMRCIESMIHRFIRRGRCRNVHIDGKSEIFPHIILLLYVSDITILHVLFPDIWMIFLPKYGQVQKKMAPKRDIRVKKIISPGLIYFYLNSHLS